MQDRNKKAEKAYQEIMAMFFRILNLDPFNYHVDEGTTSKQIQALARVMAAREVQAQENATCCNGECVEERNEKNIDECKSVLDIPIRVEDTDISFTGKEIIELRERLALYEDPKLCEAMKALVRFCELYIHPTNGISISAETRGEFPCTIDLGMFGTIGELSDKLHYYNLFGMSR